MNKTKNCLESCDMFDFMSKHVGLNVLHPGGLKATADLLDELQIRSNYNVLDIACGKGVNSIMIAKKYGCRVTGIDILDDSIKKAKRLAKENKVEHLVTFQTADAQKLPFEDHIFDITLAQAMLILVDRKEDVLREAKRVTKQNGKSGWLELSWKKEITNEFLEIANRELCGLCIGNVQTYDKWSELFQNAGYDKITVNKYPMTFRGITGMIQDEGVKNGISVMYKYMTNKKIRYRMQKIDRFFSNYSDYVGYGIYIVIN
jgi:ubiquinone/menaquinone biosynthesis C-methylase UbiE